jgi:sugar lactone lactonase YvrE
MSDTIVLVDGFSFAEAARWRRGRLWLSDFFTHEVSSIDPRTGDRRIEAIVPNQPSGLGWLPNGDLLVVSMLDRTLLRRTAEGEMVLHADLGRVATYHCNDMVVDSFGRAYVGNFGFDLHGFIEDRGLRALLDLGADVPPAALALVAPDGAVEVAASDLAFPNGVVLTTDGRKLVVAETFGRRLTAFDVSPDGRLSGRRVWADLSSHDVTPDGICLDAEGAIWVTNPDAPMAVRAKQGEGVVDIVDTDMPSFSCALGGDDGRSLFLLTAPDSMPKSAAPSRRAKVEMARVSVPGA